MGIHAVIEAYVTTVVANGTDERRAVKVNNLALVLGLDEDSSQKRGSEREQTVRALVRLVYQLVHRCDTKKAGMAAHHPCLALFRTQR